MESFVGEEYWSPLENFNEVLDDFDFDGQDWLEYLNETHPTQATEELTDHCTDLITRDLGSEDDGCNVALPGIASSSMTNDGDLGFLLMDDVLLEMDEIESSSSKATMEANIVMEGGSSSSVAEEVLTLSSPTEPEAQKQPSPVSATEASTKAIAPTSTKGMSWTEEEHRLFLIGIDVHGRGDWRNIAKNFVTTRTPTQVASHAQKFFKRQLQFKKRYRRSIHDIRSIKTPMPTKMRKLSIYDLIDPNKPLDIPNANNASQSNSPFLHQPPTNYSMANSQFPISNMIAGVRTFNANNLSQLNLPSLPQPPTNHTTGHSQFPVSYMMPGVGTFNANNISRFGLPSSIQLPPSYTIQHPQFPVSSIMTSISPSVINNVSQFDSPSLLQAPPSYTMEHFQFSPPNMRVEVGTSNTNGVPQLHSLSFPQPPMNGILEHSEFPISNITSQEGEERASLVAPIQLPGTVQQSFGNAGNMMIGPSFTTSSTAPSTMWSF